MNLGSIGGAQYFITFIDECSRYAEVVMLRNKSDALQIFKNYKRKIDNLLVKRIKKLRTDNSKEYMSKEFALFKE